MKRRIDSEISLGSELKRRSSSLFSISTVLEGDDVVTKSLMIDGRVPSVSTIAEGQTSLQRSSISISSGSKGGGDFFIEDDDEDEDETSLMIPFKSAMVPSSLPNKAVAAANEDQVTLVSVENDDLTLDQTGDFRTGLVVEASEQHFDRYNRFHKERPLRVTAIHDALSKSDDQLAERCIAAGRRRRQHAIFRDGFFE